MAGRHVFFRQGSAFPEKILLQLTNNYFLVFTPRRIQAILVEQHFAMLAPHSPGFLGHVLVNLLPQLIIEWWFLQARQFSLQFHAKNISRHNFLLNSTCKTKITTAAV